MTRIRPLTLIVLVFAIFGSAIANHRVNVSIIADEAEAVLTILAKRRESKPINESDWDALFNSSGYVRLKKREAAMKREFTDGDFRAFVLSDELLGRYTQLEETLKNWKLVDAAGPASKALAYLPSNALIRAKIYPIIKPKENSFVFDVKEDPAIFVYIDPKMTKDEFDNLLAHELHHIGYGTTCPPPGVQEMVKKMPVERQKVIKWTGAFAEGIAMLAAADGIDRHPHEFSPAEDKIRWDKDVLNFNSDLLKVQSFFLELLNGKLTEEAELEKARSFYGIQGPWYTVGWKMAEVIERKLGRQELIKCSCDERRLLTAYNKAAIRENRERRAGLALWSEQLTGN